MMPSKTRGPYGARKQQRGFTLIELLVTMVVVGILTAIAVPSYGSYVLRTARADARATMLQVNQYMERFYALNSAYDQKLDGTPVVLPEGLTKVPANATNPRYNISIEAATLTANTYSIQAVPANSSASDVCGTLTLNSVGVRGATGQPSKDGIAECWR